MRKTRAFKNIASVLAAALLVSLPGAAPVLADAHRVVTLGADLTEEQKKNILTYFNVSENEVSVITVTNAEERALLEGQYTSSQIGTHTLSCALVNPTDSGGIQVKTANTNVVTSERIASALSTSGVVNCEVLTAAPFMVSGTGALTGALIAYESASGETLDEDKKEMAVIESKTTSEIGEKIGQDGATLIVNDIKIRIIRDNEEAKAAVDGTLGSLEGQLTALAERNGDPGPQALGDGDLEALYAYGERLGGMNYSYDEMKVTLQRVTNNIAGGTGIEDPIQETFEDLSAEDVLPANSVLRKTNDGSMGAGANITATSAEALANASASGLMALPVPGPASAEPAVRGVSLKKLGEAAGCAGLIAGTNLLSMVEEAPEGSPYRYRYALADLDGKLLTKYRFAETFRGACGLVTAADPGTGKEGLFTGGGKELIPLEYPVIEVIGPRFAAGIRLAEGSGEHYDYRSLGGDYFLVDAVDIYYISGEKAGLIGTLPRAAYESAQSSGDYLNVRNRTDGTITTYDSSFKALSKDGAYLSDFGDYAETTPQGVYDSESQRYFLADAAGNALTAPFADLIYNFYGDCAKFTVSGENGGEERSGLINREGKIVLPAAFDEIEIGYDGPYDENDENSAYNRHGYYQFLTADGKFGFAAAGGEVTCEPAYMADAMDVRGVSAYHQNPDGSFLLLAADGTETKLDRSCTGLRALGGTDGFLLLADGEKPAIVDWHGKVLLKDFYEAGISRDGYFLVVRLSPSPEDPVQIYQISYLT